MFALLAVLAVLHLTAKDNGKSFTVAPRTTVVLTLPSNASTGYHWVWETVMDAPHATRYVSHRYVQPKKSIPGAPGKEIWRFAATQKGSEVLQFAYERTSRSPKAARRFDVTIRVR